MRRNTILAITALSANLALAACGSTEDTPFPTKSYTAEVSNSAGVTVSPSLRVAVVWGNVAKNGNTYQVSQDVPLGLTGVGSFTLDLVQPPPAALLMTTNQVNEERPNDGTLFGLGSPVIYEDKNGNGKLDMVAPGTSQPVDAIVGADARLLIMYIDATTVPAWLASPASNDDFEGQLTVGFNLVHIPEFCFASDCPEDKAKVYQPGESFSLPLTADPRLNAMMCSKASGSSTGSSGVINMENAKPDAYPTAENVTCDSDGDSYSETTCAATIEGLCEGEHTECMTRVWNVPDPANPPQDWPCKLSN